MPLGTFGELVRNSDYMLLPIHIAAGALAIVCGAVALLVRKGGWTHRRSGWIFVGAMLVMGATAGALGFLKSGRLTDGNVLGGLMVFYLVGTAWTTVRPPSPATRAFGIAGLIVAIGIALFDIAGGLRALRAPRGMLNGVPFPMFFFLATILLLAAIGDVRVLRSGALRGGPRLARHLWRMCFALFVAAGSFFSIRARVARVLPEPFTSGPMRALPILLVFVAMFYWLWRVRRRLTPPLP